MSVTKQLLTTRVGGGPSLVSTPGLLLALAPWNFTGQASHTEWKDVPVGAQEYRSSSPTATSSNLKVPQNSVQRIYDIRYFMRDARRFALKGDLLKETLTPSSFMDSLRETSSQILRREALQHVCAPLSKAASARVSLLDDPNNGFT